MANGFVWLDHTEIVEGGYRLTEPSDFVDVWSQPLDTFQFRDDGTALAGGGYWRPLLALSLTLDWALWNNDAALYHAENILLHAGVVLTLFAVGRRLLSDDPDATRVSFLASLLFAVLPLNVHSVTWISGRKDLLCALGSGLAVLAFLTVAHSRRRLLVTGSGGVCLLLALLCKETAVVVPLLLSWIVWCRVGVPANADSRSVHRWYRWLLAATWLLTALWFVARIQVTGGFALNAPPLPGNVADQTAGSARLWLHYVGRVLQPVPAVLSDRWPATAAVSLTGVLSITGLIVGLQLTAAAVRRRAAWSHGWVWFCCWTLPATGQIPLRHVRAERYLYPASWGLLLCVCWLMLAATRGYPRLRRLTIRMLVAISVFWAGVSALENQRWQNDGTLFEHAVRQDPEYVEGRLGLAHWHLSRGDYAAAAEHSRMAIDMADDSTDRSYWSPWIARSNYGLALYHLGDFAGAADQFDRAIALQPALASGWSHRGLTRLARQEFRGARDDFREALDRRPGDRATVGNLAFAHLQLGEIDSAAELLRPLVAVDPENLVNRRNLGTALLLAGRPDEALPHLKYVAGAGVADAGDFARVAWCHQLNGKPASAREWLRRAEARDAGHPTVRHVRRIVGDDPSYPAGRR